MISPEYPLDRLTLAQEKFPDERERETNRLPGTKKEHRNGPRSRGFSLWKMTWLILVGKHPKNGGSSVFSWLSISDVPSYWLIHQGKTSMAFTFCTPARLRVDQQRLAFGAVLVSRELRVSRIFQWSPWSPSPRGGPCFFCVWRLGGWRCWRYSKLVAPPAKWRQVLCISLWLFIAGRCMEGDRSGERFPQGSWCAR